MTVLVAKILYNIETLLVAILTVLVWPNIDVIVKTLLVAILIYCEVSIRCD